jgi:hypothetical protein
MSAAEEYDGHNMIGCADFTVMDVIEVNDTKLKGTRLTKPGNLSLELIA